MRKLWILLILFSHTLLAQVSADVNKLDFAPVFASATESHNTLGFIGSDYQRIQVKLISVIKNPDKAGQYLVYGKTMVKDNVCDFQGILTITKTVYSAEQQDPQYKEGVLEGTYLFFEDPAQKHVGQFKGSFSSDWYLDKAGKVHYNDLMIDADGYSNNMFTGTWSSYGGAITKPCNWGDYRIPNCGDLDSGDGEFISNAKYRSKGWQSYVDAMNAPLDARAKQTPWWK